MTPIGEREVLVFLQNMRQYRTKGGKKSILKFVDKFLVNNIQMYEIDGEMNEETLENFLNGLCVQKMNFLEKYEYIQKNVRVDENIDGDKEKLRLLLVSLDKALAFTKLEHISFQNQKQLLISKLPAFFSQAIKAYEFVNDSEIKTVKEFWKFVTSLNYSWKDNKCNFNTQKTKKKDAYMKEEEACADSYKEIRRSSRNKK